jgi:hypothetical protein
MMLSPEAREARAIARMVWDFDAGTLVLPRAGDGDIRRIIGMPTMGYGNLSLTAQIIAEHSPGVFVVVAMNAEILPVAPVGWVVFVVPVPVMNG